jgi:stage III sporulation protein AF
MREVVYAWAQQLVFLILFVTVVEMILPAGELRRYTKMVVGLVVILAVLDPLLQVVQGPRWTDLLISVPADEVMAPSRAVEAGRRMLADATMATKAGVAEEAEALILTVDGVQRVAVDLDGDVPRIAIVATTTTNSADVAERVERLARVFLGVAAISIRVEVEQGGP